MAYGRLGYTTGACAAAAAAAAVHRLLGNDETLESVEIPFPGGKRHALPVAFVRTKGGGVEAGVVKDAGDDPDVTHGALVIALVEWVEAGGVVFAAGDGVGTVSKKGLLKNWNVPGMTCINPGMDSGGHMS